MTALKIIGVAYGCGVAGAVAGVYLARPGDAFGSGKLFAGALGFSVGLLAGAGLGAVLFA